jgi:hypothetical protein
VANAFISPFKTQTMHIKSYYTHQHCYVSLKTLYTGGIRTRVFSVLRRMQCPLRHAAIGRAIYLSTYVGIFVNSPINKHSSTVKNIRQSGHPVCRREQVRLLMCKWESRLTRTLHKFYFVEKNWLKKLAQSLGNPSRPDCIYIHPQELLPNS